VLLSTSKFLPWGWYKLLQVNNMIILVYNMLITENFNNTNIVLSDHGYTK